MNILHNITLQQHAVPYLGFRPGGRIYVGKHNFLNAEGYTYQHY